MSFKWKCDKCNTGIIVPFESLDVMSPYADPLCPDCYSKFERNYEMGAEEYDVETEDPEVTCRCYADMMGILFECKKIEEDVI